MTNIVTILAAIPINKTNITRLRLIINAFNSVEYISTTGLKNFISNTRSKTIIRYSRCLFG